MPTSRVRVPYSEAGPRFSFFFDIKIVNNSKALSDERKTKKNEPNPKKLDSGNFFSHSVFLQSTYTESVHNRESTDGWCERSREGGSLQVPL